MSDVELRFVVVTDGHWNSGYEYQHSQALDLIDQIHDEREIDFIVHCGDIVSDDETVHETVIDEFFSKLPADYYPVYGNHDWATEDEWQDYYGLPFRYTWEAGDYGCISTNTGTPSRDSDWTAADASWIEDQIDGFSGKDGVFVFQHVAPFEETDIVGLDMPDVREQIGRDEVVACFLGHNHQKNIREDHDGGRYFYANSIGGVREAEQPYEVEDDGLRVFDVVAQ